MILYAATDGTIYGLGMHDPVTGLYIDTLSSFSVSILDGSGAAVATVSLSSIGASTPVTVLGVTYPAGNYSGILPASTAIVAGQSYTFLAVATTAGGKQATFGGSVQAGYIPLTN